MYLLVEQMCLFVGTVSQVNDMTPGSLVLDFCKLFGPNYTCTLYCNTILNIREFKGNNFVLLNFYVLFGTH